jgi:tetratricopeptide (TPR) repeat protein
MLLAVICAILLQAVAGLLPQSDVTRIANANYLRKEAQKAIEKKDYATAVNHYNYLLDTLRVADDAASLNVAHALLKEKKTNEAQQAYTKATQATKNTVRATAYTQLGVLSAQKQQDKEALQYFKQALKENPRNEYARYNYELLKRKMEQTQNKQDNKNKDQQQNQDNKNQEQQQNKENQQDKEGQNKEQQNKEQEEKNKEGQEKEQQNKDGKEKEQDKNPKNEAEGKDGKKGEKEKPQANKQALQEMNMSEEKAQMILEAMKNNEIQYIQQRQHKAKKRPERNKPDW